MPTAFGKHPIRADDELAGVLDGDVVAHLGAKPGSHLELRCEGQTVTLATAAPTGSPQPGRGRGFEEALAEVNAKFGGMLARLAK